MPFPDSLVALRDGAPYSSHPGDRPRRLRLDSDGCGLSIEVPGPRVLATTLVLPWLASRGIEGFRSRTGTALLTRPVGSTADPSPVDIVALRRDLTTTLRALPERPDAGRPYNDLRLLVRMGSPAKVDTFLTEAVASARRLAPTWTVTRPARPHCEPIAEPARVRQYRARVRTDRDTTGREWLESALTHGDLIPGERIAAGELWARARDDFLDLDGATDDEGNPARVPGRSRFYALADAVLGPRRIIRGSRYYVIPTPAEEPPARPSERTFADLANVTGAAPSNRSR